jgi:hypothetical protein
MPTTTLTDSQGRVVEVTVHESSSESINRLVHEVYQLCPTPAKAHLNTVRTLSLSAIASRDCLAILNNDLVEKARQKRVNKNRKHFGEARILTSEEALQQIEERADKETAEKARKRKRVDDLQESKLRKALFAEMPAKEDVFSFEITSFLKKQEATRAKVKRAEVAATNRFIKIALKELPSKDGYFSD